MGVIVFPAATLFKVANTVSPLKSFCRILTCAALLLILKEMFNERVSVIPSVAENPLSGVTVTLEINILADLFTVQLICWVPVLTLPNASVNPPGNTLKV